MWVWLDISTHTPTGGSSTLKLGLGDSYDKVTILTKKTRAYIDITKPASTIGVAGGFFLGLLFYYAHMGMVSQIVSDIDTILFACVTMALAHAASQAMNMAEDAEMDRNTPHKQNRPIPAGIITEEEARTLAWFALLAAVGRAYIINNQFGLVVTILAVFGVFYNLDPIRAKERVISVPWQAVSRGLLMFPAVWAVSGDIMSPTAWAFGLVMFFYVLGFQNSADLIDRHVDAEYGISTWVVEFGVGQVVIIASFCTMMIVSVASLGYSLEAVSGSIVYTMGIVPLCVVMLYHMAFNTDSVDERTGNHPAWTWFYGGMVLTVVLPIIGELWL